MPMTNGAYESPTWRNGAPPPLSVSECNGLAGAAESAQEQIGDILFSTRSAVEMGANWLKCDGGYVDVFQNPELAELLGSEWSNGTMPISGSWLDVTYGNGKFAALREGNPTSSIAYSTDGKYWTEAANLSGVYSKIIYGGGRFVAFDMGGTKAAYSENVTDWTQTSTGKFLTVIGCAAYGDGKFVAVSRSDSKAIWSDDNGETWNEVATPSGSWYGMTFGAGKFVAVSSDGKTMYSADGKEWTLSVTLPSIQGNQWYYISFGNGRFLALGSRGNTAYSTDGVSSWVSGASAPSGFYRDMVFGNGKFMAISEGSNWTAYSADGLQWTKTTMASTAQYWIAIAYGNGKFVIIESSSNISSCLSEGKIPNIEKTYGTAYIRAKNGGAYSAPDFSTAKLSAANLNALCGAEEAWQKKHGDIVITGRNALNTRFQMLAAKEQGMNVFRKSSEENYSAEAWTDGRPPAIGPKRLQPLSDAAEDGQKRVGDILFSVRSSITGFLECDGSAISAAQYPVLASIFGENLPTITQTGVTAFVKAG